MQLSEKFWVTVDHFMEVIHKETGFPVLIYDEYGCIVRATDTSRIGDRDAGVQKIMRHEVDEYPMAPEEAGRDPQVREGFICPVVIEGKRVAAFGITGDLKQTEPLAKVAGKLLISWLQDLKHQEELARTEEKYFKAFNNSPVWVVISSMESGRYIEVNETFLRTMGYRREEVLGRTSLDLSSWEHPAERQTILEEIKAKGCVRNHEVRRVTRTGRLLTMLFSAEIIEVSGEACLLSVSQDISARKQAEENLRLSENNLRITLDSIGDAVISADAVGRITRMNPMAERLTGWPVAEAMGMPLPEVMHVIDARTRLPAINPADQVLAKGGVLALAEQSILISKDGNEYRIAHSGAPIRGGGDEGEVVGVVLVFRNVTESYAQAQIISDNERHLKNISSNLPGVVYEFHATRDHVYTVRFVSEKADEIFGLNAPLDRYFEAFYACIPDEEKPGFMASVREAVDLVRPWYYEGRFIKPDGKMIWFSGSGTPIQDGDSIIYYGVVMDNTERKLWQQSLAASERRFRDLFNEAPVMYVITETRQEEPYIQDVNNMFTETLGYSRQEVLNTPLKNYYTEDSAQKMLAGGGYQRALKGRFTEEERTFLTRDGQKVHTLLHSLPEIDSTGQVTGTRAMFLDITAGKYAEEKTRRLQAALAQSQKMEAIGTLAGGIAHDFNNILAAVIGYAELSLSSMTKGSRVRQNIEQILIAGLRARDLVRQILTFSRENEHELKPLQIEPLIKEALNLLRSSLPSTIEISQYIDPNLDNVMADPIQIHQIIMNLCTNAAQAMEENGGLLTIRLSGVRLTHQDLHLHPGLKPGAYIKLGVQDTGTGISKEIRDKIYHPYFTTKEKGAGTGLGLSVVHGIVQSYGGVVNMDSEPGQGTTFNIYIPAINRPVLVVKPDSEELPTGCERILFVDDEPSLVALGQKMLEKLGYQVTPCNGSLEALEAFSQAPQAIDLVISDLTMPKMTGDKLAERLLQIRPGLPIVLCTGFGRKITNETAAALGIRKIVTKPLAVRQLAQTVRAILDEG